MNGTIEFCQKQAHLEDEYFTRVVGLHAFNIMPKLDPRLVKMTEDKSSPIADQIQDILVKPYAYIAEQTVSKETKDALIQHADDNLIKPHSQGSFQKDAAMLDKTNMSVYDYYQSLLGIVKKYNQSESAALALNQCLLRKALPSKDREALQTGALMVYNTNWNTGDDLSMYFSFVFNPAAKTLALAAIDSKRNDLRLVKSSEWVEGKTWIIFTETMKDTDAMEKEGEKKEVKTVGV